MSWRDLLTQAQAVVHETFSFSASYTDALVTTPITVVIRVHEGQTVDVGTPGLHKPTYFAAGSEVPVQIVMDLADMNPQRGGIFILGDGRHYRLDRELITRFGYSTWEAIAL